MAIEPSNFFNIPGLSRTVPAEIGLEIFKHLDLSDMASVAQACKEGVDYQYSNWKSMAIRLGGKPGSEEESREFVRKIVERVRDVMDRKLLDGYKYSKEPSKLQPFEIAESLASQGQLVVLCPWLQAARRRKGFKALPAIRGSDQVRAELLTEACRTGNAADLLLAWIHKAPISIQHLKHFCLSENGLEGIKDLYGYGLPKLGRDFLLAACETGRLDIIEFLLEQNVQLENYCLQLAAEKGQCEVIQFLAEKNLDVNGVNPSNRTALHYAASHGHVDAILALLEVGAEIDSMDQLDHESPAFLAARHLNWDSLYVLLEAGADPNLVNQHHSTLFHYAIIRGHAPAVKALVEAGADLELVNAQGYTPLQECAIEGQVDCLDILVQAGADFSAKDPNGKTAYDLAKENGHPECQKMLFNARIASFFSAISEMFDHLAFLHR